MGLSPILAVIHAVTIYTMLKFNGDSNEHDLTKRCVWTGLKSIWNGWLYQPNRMIGTQVKINLLWE